MYPLWMNRPPFPDVTVCSLQHLDVAAVRAMEEVLLGKNCSFTEESNIFEWAKHYGMFIETASSFFAPYLTFGETVEQARKDFAAVFSKKGFLANVGQQAVSLGGIQKEDFIISCKYGGNDCKDDIITYFDSEYYNCFAFQSRGNTPQDAILELVLFTGVSGNEDVLINQGDYQKFLSGLEPTDLQGQGVKVILHSETSSPRSSESSVEIGAGKKAVATTKLSMYSRLEPPFGDCYSKTDYNNLDCRNKCRAKITLQQCGCTDIFSENDVTNHCLKLPHLPAECANDMRARECSEVLQRWWNTMKCLKKVSMQFDYCNCPPQCYKDHYDVTLQEKPLGHKPRKSRVKTFLGKQIEHHIDQLDATRAALVRELNTTDLEDLVTVVQIKLDPESLIIQESVAYTISDMLTDMYAPLMILLICIASLVASILYKGKGNSY